MGAQATRNRELEQQLSSYRSEKSLMADALGVQGQTHGPSLDPSLNSHGNGNCAEAGMRERGHLDKGDEMRMMLHEEVGDGVGEFVLPGIGFSTGFGKGMFELASMPEGGEDMEVEDGEGRPSTGGLSPSVGSAEGSVEREEEERGRRGRDGRVRGAEEGTGRERVKKSEEGEKMES